MIPMPPSQWVTSLQKRIPRGFASMSAITEARVVLKPETASKKASVKVGTEPQR